MSEYTQDAFDALQESAATFDGEGNLLTTTDTLGNIPYLFIDNNYCEHFKFQLQGADSQYIEGLTPGASGSFTFNPQIPMEDLRIGAVTIFEPADLQATYLPASTSEQLFNAFQYNRYSRGGCQEDAPDSCSDLSYCFGARVSEVEAFEGVLELVDDGTADPTLGCNDFVDFTPGNIALMERGVCNFDIKVFNAELAGATAVFMVNDGRCGGTPPNANPPSDDCALNMGESRSRGTDHDPCHSGLGQHRHADFGRGRCGHHRAGEIRSAE